MKKLLLTAIIFAGSVSLAAAQKAAKRVQLQPAEKTAAAKKASAEKTAAKLKAEQKGTTLQRSNPDAALIDPRALNQQKTVSKP